ncbi:hypothetical protein SUGI_1078350 [Cryptomeria japonica]|nr:hypothetical protein SUGI_1078350 [Cryptomeria japonica]
MLTWNDFVQYWESGTWDDHSFSAVPEMVNGDYYEATIENTSSGLYFSYKLLKGISRFLQIKSGGIQEYALFDATKRNV